MKQAKERKVRRICRAQYKKQKLAKNQRKKTGFILRSKSINLLKSEYISKEKGAVALTENNR